MFRGVQSTVVRRWALLLVFGLNVASLAAASSIDAVDGRGEFNDVGSEVRDDVHKDGGQIEVCTPIIN